MWQIRGEIFKISDNYNPYNKKHLHIWGGISFKGKTNLYFFEKTVNSEEYIKCLQFEMIPRARELFRRR